jgi:hypothetical protein
MKPMATNGYTPEELEAAKDFLRKRLESEQSMSADVERLLYTYAGYLLSALFAASSETDIEDLELLIQDLIEQLMADCELLAVDEREDKRDAILFYMASERNGDTLEGRVNKRCHTFYNEVFAVYMAGELLGLNEKSLLSSIKANFEHPWDNEVLVAVREKINRGEIDADIADFEEPHFGKGVEISSLGALQTILGYAIADAWTWWQYEDAKENGAKGYHVLRGSSYPCEICDSHTGIFYLISDEDNKPQYHAHCCCLVVYSYVDRI